MQINQTKTSSAVSTQSTQQTPKTPETNVVSDAPLAKKPASMKNVLADLRKNWLLIFGFFIILVLVFSTLLRLLTPADQSLDNLPTAQEPLPALEVPRIIQQDPELVQIEYIGEQIDVPTTLPIYQNQADSTNLELIIQPIVERLQLKPIANQNNSWRSADEAYTLYYSPSLGNFYLNNFTPNIIDQNTRGDFAGISEQEVAREVQKTLQNMGVDVSSSTYQTNVRFLSGDPEPQPVTRENAILARTTFSPIINSYPVFYNNQTGSSSWTLTNSQHELVKLFITPTFIAPTPTVQAKLLSIDEAVEQLNQDNYTTINAYKTTGNNSVEDIENLANTQLDTVQIEYRLLSDKVTLYPYYRFSGKSSASYDDPIYYVELITPAIATQ